MTGTIIRHSLVRQLAALALFAIWFSAAAFAQSATFQTPAPKANLIIERQAVRFDLQGAARSWQLEVFNQSGDLIFGSGVVNQATIEWALTDQQEKPLADGLYAYTLKFWNENNEAMAIQRGHVIVNRASSSDRIWVTSNNASGVGAGSGELTVVGSPESTIGGVKLAETATPPSLRATSERTQTEAARASGGSTDPQQLKSGGVNAVGIITGDGTAGRIAKFTGANTIDDSAMTETGGNIQLGTNLNLARLTVVHTNVRGIYGRSDTLTGVWGQSISSNGVYGYSSTGNGAYGYSLSGWGVLGVSNANYGVYGSTSAAGAAGVYGESSDGLGVSGESQSNSGVRGQSNSGAGVFGISSTGRGIWGVSNSDYGAMGQSSGNHGVYGRSSASKLAGVHGQSTSIDGIGVRGDGNVAVSETPSDVNQASIGVLGVGGGYGVRGESNAGHGVAGFGSFLGASIYGASGAAWAGYFDGKVVVTGNLAKGGGSFKIDHPLDPANKYLYHSFVESPDMMNIYNGSVTTDANGEATVTLPDYFEALNRDFRYQLTVIGQFAQAIVAGKIQGNSFTIKTDKPGVEVSWQVTGIRKDAYANANRIPIEEDKPAAERGHYLHPAAFNQPEEKSLEWARHPEMMKRMKADREQRQSESGQKPQK
jgi:hypothetical protein